MIGFTGIEPCGATDVKHLSPIERGLVWFGVFWIAAILLAFAFDVLAASDAVIEKAEEDGIDALTAALIALVTAVAGWFGKQEVSKRTGAGATDALAKHEEKCDRRQERIHAKFDEVRTELTEVRSQLSDLSNTVARLEGRLGHFMGDGR